MASVAFYAGGDSRPGLFALRLAALVTGWLALSHAVHVVGMSMGVARPASAALAALALVLTVLVANARPAALAFLPTLATAGAAFGLVALGFVLALSTHDFSHDGQEYHQEAILALMDGWNPIAQTEYPGAHSIWLSHYPKGGWIVSAALSALAGNVEAGKALTWLLAWTGALCAYAWARCALGLEPRAAALAAALCALNPVLLIQLQTYNTDGQVASVLLTFAAASLCALRPGLCKPALAVCASCVALGVNLKVPLVAYLGVIGVSSVAWGWLGLRRVKEARALLVTGLAGGVVGLALGFNPYATNLRDHGHPLYPLAGANKVDILTGHVSADFLAQNRLHKLWASWTSVSTGVMAKSLDEPGKQFQAKFPFAVAASEVKAFYKYTDVRVNGFGPWVSAAVMSMLLAAIWRLWVGRRDPSGATAENGVAHREVAVLAGALFSSALLMPELWWARYAPQLWVALVTMGLLCSPLLPGSPSGAVNRAVLGLPMYVLAGNLMLVGPPALASRVIAELDYRAQLESIRRMDASNEAEVQYTERSAQVRLSREGLEPQQARESRSGWTCENLVGSRARVCMGPTVAGSFQRTDPRVERYLGQLR